MTAFVLGSARCGSTLVSRVIRMHPELLSLSEVFSTAGPHAFPQGRISAARFWRGLSRPTRLGAAMGNPTRAPDEFLYGAQSGCRFDPHFCPPILSVALPHLSDRPDALFHWLGQVALQAPRQDAGAHYRHIFGALAQRMGRRVWVERSGGSVVAAATLQELFPQARFVWLTRNGADTVLSMRDYPAARMAVWMWKRLRPLGLDLLAPGGHYGRAGVWRWLQAAGGVMPKAPILDRRPDLADVAAFWSHMMIRGAQAMAAIPPGRILHLSYEALTRDPAAQLARLGDFLAGSAPEDWLRRAAALPRTRPSRADALPANTRARLLDACAPGEAAVRDHVRRLAGE